MPLKKQCVLQGADSTIAHICEQMGAFHNQERIVPISPWKGTLNSSMISSTQGSGGTPLAKTTLGVVISIRVRERKLPKSTMYEEVIGNEKKPEAQ